MSWPQDAYVGQEVVCINLNDTTNEWHLSSPLTINAVYKICEIHIGGPYKHLYFVVNDSTDRYWLHSTFRPITKTKTDISIFTAMLGPKAKERIDA